MNTLEKGHDRIQGICEKIRVETLEPARQEAEEILNHAKREAEKLLAQAHQKAQAHVEESKKQLEEEKKIFVSSLEQATKQTLETLKQKIEHQLFSPTLDEWLLAQLGSPEASAKLLEALVHALEKDGIETNLHVRIAQQLSPQEVIAHLSKTIAQKLKAGSITMGDFPCGIQIHLKDKHVMLDVSDSVLRELMASFLRKDFRKYFFTET